MVNNDTPAGQGQLGTFYQSTQQYARAEAAYLHALMLEPLYLPARLNLADMHRTAQAETKVMDVLTEGLRLLPDQPDLNFAFGLSLVRQGQLAQAVAPLNKAALNAPENPRYAYVYSVALYESGERESAIEYLRTIVEQMPNRELISALISYLRVSGLTTEADAYQARLDNL